MYEDDFELSSRSRLSNDPLALDGVDGRSGAARRFRDVTRELVAALPERRRTAVNMILLKRAAALVVQSEQMDARLARGEDVSPQHVSNCAGALLKLMTVIGLARVPAAGASAPAADEDDPLEAYLQSKGYSMNAGDPIGDLADDIDYDDQRVGRRRAASAPAAASTPSPRPRRRSRPRVRIEE
jgi:hypothetical protein